MNKNCLQLPKQCRHSADALSKSTGDAETFSPEQPHARLNKSPAPTRPRKSVERSKGEHTETTKNWIKCQSHWARKPTPYKKQGFVRPQLVSQADDLRLPLTCLYQLENVGSVCVHQSMYLKEIDRCLFANSQACDSRPVRSFVRTNT